MGHYPHFTIKTTTTRSQGRHVMTTPPARRPLKEVMTEMWTTIAVAQQKAEAGHATYLGSITAELLRRAIIDRLIPLPKELEERLFDAYGPLATFSGRIDGFRPGIDHRQDSEGASQNSKD
jgi:hypothetical protein